MRMILVNFNEVLQVDREQAEAMALDALAFIVENIPLRGRFLDLTGLNPDELRDRIMDPALHIAIIEFLLSHEPSLLEFTAARDIAPQLPAQAHAALTAHQSREWS